jgi:hypothetical protein
MPPGAELGNRMEGVDVAEVVTDEAEATGAEVAGESLHHIALVRAGRPDLDDLLAGLDDHVVPLGG